MVEDIDRDPNQNMDILFRNTSTGLVRIWFLNESAEIENNVQVSDSVVSVSSWSVVGIARVGYNTARDIIWRNTSNGRLVGWQLGSDGVRYGSYTIINSVSSNLQIKAMTEY